MSAPNRFEQREQQQSCEPCSCCNGEGGGIMESGNWCTCGTCGGSGNASSGAINVLALIKGEERYVFLYDDAGRAEVLRMLGRFASDPELSFSFYDATVLSQRIRQEAGGQGLH